MSAKPKERRLSSPLPDGLKNLSSVWPSVLLSDCAVVQTGVAKGRKLTERESIAVPYLRVANVQDGYLDLDEIKTIEIKKSELPRFQLQHGDVLLTEGGDFDKLGRGFVWHGQIDPCVHQNHVFAVRVDRNQLTPEFFAYLAQSSYGKAYFLSVAHKTTNLACINTTKLKAFPVLIPPLPEQQKIAAVLGVVQRAMEQQERLLALTAELKKTLLHQLFTQGLRHEPQKQTDIGPVPESWEITSIGSLGKVVTGSTPKTKVPEFYAPHEADFIAPADLGNTKGIHESEKKISHAGLATIRPLPAKAVMCVCIGSSIGKVGMTTKPQSATNQQINSIICHDRHDPDFVFYLLSYLCTYWRGFATFGPVPILSKGSFELIKIATPPTREEEQEIATILSACDAKVEAHHRKHATLTALFRTLLHQMMTAQIRVADIDLPSLS